ncbi:hypothetical protein QO034_07435 [Sedimentitalea sp. JM2-8]|uniref:Uncharacterized protein n=1 Tax=Sedimentitalea xiamensis TaxID=3050037 RepID=A0ABT7FCU5_9RHOB|nr:hypothetical protein [Sedimentitalea xiamensis]MDK3072938.1 hypothetical protein [Sedimentitalea xiamensis]
MTLITPDECVSRTAELLESVHESLQRLRQQAEDLRMQLEAGEDTDLADGSKQVAAIERLIGACQKVEISLDEQHKRQAGIVRGDYALDMDVIRFEIGCRLARLRTCGDT